MSVGHRAGALEVLRVGGRRSGGKQRKREGGEERGTQAHLISNGLIAWLLRPFPLPWRRGGGALWHELGFAGLWSLDSVPGTRRLTVAELA